MSKKFLAIGVLAAAAALSGCGGPGIEGVYMPQNDAFFDSLTFMGNGQAEVELIGVRHQGSYEFEDDVLTLVALDGTRTPLNFDGKGCLSHIMMGTYCRDGDAPSTAAASSGSSGGTERYQARVDEGVITLELQSGGRAVMSMAPFGGGDDFENLSFTISYQTTSDGVIVSLPGDDPLRFTRSGRDLVGTMDGETARFVRQ